MSKRKKNIHIEKFGLSNNRFGIYSDLSIWQIESIAGVMPLPCPTASLGDRVIGIAVE